MYFFLVILEILLFIFDWFDFYSCFVFVINFFFSFFLLLLRWDAARARWSRVDDEIHHHRVADSSSLWLWSHPVCLLSTWVVFHESRGAVEWSARALLPHSFIWTISLTENYFYKFNWSYYYYFYFFGWIAGEKKFDW